MTLRRASAVPTFLALFGLAFAADDRPRLHPLPPQSQNARSGPAVGAHIPDFEVAGLDGSRQTFEALRGPKGLALLFARSADWCPYCKTQIADLDQRAPEFRKRGLGVAVLTYDSVAILKNFATRQKISIALVSDEGSKAIRAFGLLNFNVDPAAPQYGIPFPGMFIVDERGIVAAKYFDDDYTERYSAAAILTREFGADGTAKTVLDTPQLTLTYSASDATFAPGRRLTLILDIDPKPKIHIYAPGVQDYIPAEWQMGTSKAWIAFPATYPTSRMLRLPAIGETVPVYDHHVRIVRDIAVGQAAEIASALTADRALSVEGSFRYQACDDKECFLPKTLLLRWSFTVGALDTERVPAELRRVP